MKQNVKILKFNYKNLEAFLTAANSNTKKKFKFRKTVTLSHSSKLTNSKNTDIIMKQLVREQQNSNIINITKNFSDALISN